MLVATLVDAQHTHSQYLRRHSTRSNINSTRRAPVAHVIDRSTYLVTPPVAIQLNLLIEVWIDQSTSYAHISLLAQVAKVSIHRKRRQERRSFR
jgi:hypothetical protein